MKISELIRELNKYMETHGDCKVDGVVAGDIYETIELCGTSYEEVEPVVFIELYDKYKFND